MLSGMAGSAVAMVGVTGCLGWFKALKSYRYLATGPVAALHRQKYVDAGSFLDLLRGSSSQAAQVLGLLVSAAGINVLGWAWWKSPSWNRASRDLLGLLHSPVLPLRLPLPSYWIATNSSALADAVVCRVSALPTLHSHTCGIRLLDALARLE
jgi:hypothetical protein